MGEELEREKEGCEPAPRQRRGETSGEGERASGRDGNERGKGDTACPRAAERRRCEGTGHMTVRKGVEKSGGEDGADENAQEKNARSKRESALDSAQEVCQQRWQRV